MDSIPAMDLFVCAVTKAEIEVGIGLLPDDKRKRALAAVAEETFAEFPQPCLPFGEAAASAYARVIVERTRAGAPVSVEDAQIAAIALVHGLTLATRNIGDFRSIPGLRIIDPWEPHPPA
jgi:predicted nucleic acid-binding protein